MLVYEGKDIGLQVLIADYNHNLEDAGTRLDKEIKENDIRLPLMSLHQSLKKLFNVYNHNSEWTNQNLPSFLEEFGTIRSLLYKALGKYKSILSDHDKVQYKLNLDKMLNICGEQIDKITEVIQAIPIEEVEDIPEPQPEDEEFPELKAPQDSKGSCCPCVIL